MATIDEQDIAQSDWFKERPQSVQEKVREYPPTEKYILKDTRQRVYIYSYDEDADGSCTTCSVLILFEDNPGISFQRRVFGIRFEDLERLN